MTHKNFDDLAVKKMMFPVPDVNHCQRLYPIKWIMIPLHSIKSHCHFLVGGLEYEFYVFHILGLGSFIIPTDEVIFFRGVGTPTR